ncbi:MAG: ornithine cyclodeaminase family protein [Chloroflexi bacterium]|nr:ornithine cyclodeaminase family protein [Chloroflexota bacterium]
MTLLLTRADVADLLDLEQAVACIEQAHREQGEGLVTPYPRAIIRSGESYLRVLPGALAGIGRMGMRFSSHGANAVAGLLLFDTRDGRLLSLMDYPYSDLRISATVGVGVRHLAEPGAKRVAMIGSGGNALGLLQATCLARPVESIAVYSPTPEHRTRFAHDASAALSIPVVATDGPEEAVDGADVVLVSTPSHVPVVEGSWLAPVAHVSSIGTSRMELADDVFLRAELVVTTSKVQEMSPHEVKDDWPWVRLDRDGSLPWDDVVELGDVATGRVRRPDGITVLHEANGGFGDMAMATRIYERALELGRGTEWDMG